LAKNGSFLDKINCNIMKSSGGMEAEAAECLIQSPEKKMDAASLEAMLSEAWLNTKNSHVLFKHLNKFFGQSFFESEMKSISSCHSKSLILVLNLATCLASLMFHHPRVGEVHLIQNQYQIGNLPSEWKTTHWPTLLVLCRDFYNSVNSSGIHPRENSQDGTSDCIAQHCRKIKQWFLNPITYCKEIAAEQPKHPDQCIYHLSASHPTETCHVKIDCDKRANSKKSVTPSSTSTTAVSSGQLRHITEEVFEDAAAVADCDSKEDLVTPNDRC